MGKQKTRADLEQEIAALQAQLADMVRLDDLVGASEVAAMFGVKLTTVYQWKSNRGVLPEPAALISGRDVWTKQQIRERAKVTGRKIVADVIGGEVVPIDEEQA
jgi:predicted DNA-binding transcriptional regulator AlpA